MEANLGWLFYKDYFRDDHSQYDISEDNIKTKAERLLKYKCEVKEFEKLGNFELIFKTTYPGLLIGSGYNHELKEIEGQLSLGFYFDYTSGLPTIPGSTIKGVLRSSFKHTEYIKEIIDPKFKIDSLKTGEEKKALIEEIEKLEKEIFESNDIFFDAFLTEKSKNKEFLSDDYITHHSSPIKNPNPIRFLKVKPEIEFNFQFKLFDGNIDGHKITKETKLKLFKAILEDFGVGAKTNVGYGQLEFGYDNWDDYFKNKKEKEENAKIKEKLEKEEEAKKKAEEKRKIEEEKIKATLNPIDLQIYEIIENCQKNPTTIIQEMQKMEKNLEMKELFLSIKKKLAEKVKLLIEAKNEWKNPKQKAIARKEYIEGILKDNSN